MDNPYLESEGSMPSPTDGGASDNPYLPIVQQEQDNLRFQAQNSLYQAKGTNPDQYAKATALAAPLGLHPDTVAANLPSFEQQADLARQQQQASSSAALESFLSNTINAKLARDDLGPLAGIADIAANAASGAKAGFAENFIPPKPGQEFRPVGIAGNLAHMAGSVAGFMAEAYASPEAATGMAGGATLGVLGGPLAELTVPGMAGAGATFGAASHVLARTFRQTMDSTADLVDQNGMPMSYAARLGLASVNSVIQSMMLGIPGGAANTAMKATEEAILRAAEQPSVQSALAGYGMAVVKGAGHAGLIGGGLDAAQQFSDQLMRGLSNATDGTQFQTWASNPETIPAAIEHVVGEGLKWAAFGGLMSGTLGTIGLGQELGAVRESQARRQAIEGLLDISAESKLRERSPDTFKEFMQQQVGGGPVEHIEIPASRIDELFQGMAVDPAKVFAFDPDFATKLAEARAIDGNVSLDTKDYAAHLAGSEFDRALRDDIAPEGGYTPRQAKEANEEIAASMQANMERLNDELTREHAAQSPMEMVYRDAFSKLRAANMGVAEAEHNARIVAAKYQTDAQKWQDAGDDRHDAWTLYGRSDVGVQRVLNTPRHLRSYDVGPMDAMINDLRAGKTGASDKEIFGPTLAEWISENGGITDPGGELRAMGADRWHLGMRGRGKLLRDNPDDQAALAGMAPAPNRLHPDDVAMRAGEAGFFPDLQGERPSPDHLFEAIRSELAGNPRRSEYAANSEKEAYAKTLTDLRGEVDRAGIDLKHPDWADNERVKDALRLSARSEGGREFNQATALRPGEEVIRAPATTAAWMGLKNVSLRADFAALQARHPESFATPEAARDAVMHVLEKPDGWFPHSAGKAMIFRQGDGEIPGVRVELSVDDDNVLRAVSAYTMTRAEVARRMNAKARWLEDRRGSGSISPSPTLAEFLREVGPPNQPYGGLRRSSKESMPPSGTEGKRAYEEAAQRLGMTDHHLKEATDAIEKVRAGEDTTGLGSDAERSEVERLLANESAGQGGGAVERGPSRFGALLDESGPGAIDGAAKPDALNQETHGSIQFQQGDGEPIKAVINLFSGADKSTFMHESAHLWLEELKRDAADETAPEVFKDDLAKVMAWMGVTSPDQIGTAQHERFARSFESYLMEGKAPAAGLEGAFGRFKSWLVNIYRRLGGGDPARGIDQAAGFHVALDPEIRDVFDRLLASEDEIKLARERQSLRQLFKSPEEAGMSPELFAAYLKAVDDAKNAALSQVEKKAIDDLARERLESWKEEEAKAREEALTQLDQRGDIQAVQAYRTGKLPDGREATMPKMDKAAIVRMFGSEGILKELNLAFGKIYAERGGLHPDIIAEMFGYKDGREFLKDLMNLKRQEREARAMTGKKGLSIRDFLADRQARSTMVERHGDIMSDGTLIDEALDAVHNDRQGEVLAAELQALKSRARSIDVKGQKVLLGPVKPQEIAKARAEAMIGAKRVREVMNLGAYERAEAKAGRAAEAALLKGDYPEAARQKEAQLMAHALWRAAKDAKDQVEKDQKLLGSYAKKATIKGLAQDYLDQIHGLLERFSFSPASEREVLRRASLADWVRRQEDAGAEVMISDKMRNEAFKSHFSELSVTDMKDLGDAVRNIAHLGRLKEKIRLGQQERDLAEAKTWLTDAAAAHPQRGVGPEMVKGSRGGLGGLLDRMGQRARTINAPLMKIEQLCLMLDGGDSNGAWNTLIFRPMKDALFKRYDYENRIVRALQDLKAKLPADWADGLGEHEFLPDQKVLIEPDSGLPARFRRKDLLAMMLNMGNDGNFDRLTEGFGGAKAGWSRDTVRDFVNRHATADDWRYAQGVWDIFESFKGEIGALQKRLSGVEPEWVKAVQVDTPHGSFRGGYFPVIYDLTRSPRAEELAEKASVQTMFGGLYNRATTPKGHTKARAEGYSAPLDLNAMDLMGGRMAQHIHDLAFRETIMDAAKLLLDPEVKRSVDAALGPEYTKEFRQWLADAATDRNVDPRATTGFDRFLKAARVNMTAVGIGWRFTTVAKHGIGALMNSIGEVGPHWMAIGARDVFHPTTGAATIEAIKEMSGEMRYRKEQYDRDVMANMQDLAQHVGLNSANGVAGGFVKMRDWWNHAGHWMVSEGDWLSALPTWQGAYKKALADGMSDADAIYAGDQAVRRAHGAQSLIDRAGIQRKSELWNAFTMFYGFFNHVWNRQVDMVDRAKWGMEKARMGDWDGAKRDFATVGWRSMFYVMVPSLIEAAVVNGTPGEDQSWFGWTAKAVAEELMAGVPILRDVGKAALEQFSGRHSELTVSPLEGGATTFLSAVYDLSSVFDDDRAMSDTALKKVITSAGILSGVGTGAPAQYAQYVWDVLAGKEQPEDAAEFTKHLLFGPPSKAKH